MRLFTVAYLVALIAHGIQALPDGVSCQIGPRVHPELIPSMTIGARPKLAKIPPQVKIQGTEVLDTSSWRPTSYSWKRTANSAGPGSTGSRSSPNFRGVSYPLGFRSGTGTGLRTELPAWQRRRNYKHGSISPCYHDLRLFDNHTLRDDYHSNNRHHLPDHCLEADITPETQHCCCYPGLPGRVTITTTVTIDD